LLFISADSRDAAPSLLKIRSCDTAIAVITTRGSAKRCWLSYRQPFYGTLTDGIRHRRSNEGPVLISRSSVDLAFFVAICYRVN